MMHKNDVKLLTESVMMEDAAVEDAEESSKQTLSRLDTMKDATGDNYKAGIIELRNSREMRELVRDPAAFKSRVMAKISAGALGHSISMSDAATIVAMMNSILAATSTTEPLTVFDVFSGARLSEFKGTDTDHNVSIDYDNYNIDLGKRVSEKLDRIIDAVVTALNGGDENDRKVLLAYGSAVALLGHYY